MCNGENWWDRIHLFVHGWQIVVETLQLNNILDFNEYIVIESQSTICAVKIITTDFSQDSQ